MKLNKEILKLEKTLSKLENLHASFDYLRISIASPKKIKSWAERVLPNGEIVGEVLKPETINFRTHQPELNGLFCEKIFGPLKNWKCKCGKYDGFVVNKVCEECQVEIIDTRVRRYRMGYIELTNPVTHLWYLRGTPNYLLELLRCFDEKLTLTDLEKIVYFQEEEKNIDKTNKLYRFFNSEKNELKTVLKSSNLQIVSSNKFNKNRRRRGAEILKAALENLNIKNEIKKARSLIDINTIKNINTTFIPEKNIIRRIRILESFLATKTDPSWMILTTLPVLPPSLRPVLELQNGRLLAADVNEIYRLIITRNQRMFDFMYPFIAPDLITIHSRKLLQESVDALIGNARLPTDKAVCLNNKTLKSLTEILEGKRGRFRQSLLGKRVDYSARSVIIVGPHLRLNQCGLPYEIAVELFQPFLIRQLFKTKIKEVDKNTKLANVIIKKNKPFIWNLLVELTKHNSILLNRAPTLHRFGIQAFDPLIVLGQAIHLHPLVCTGFNADFDGDQMAVHLPLYEASQLEAKTIMRPSYNVLSPSNGEVILKPTQDMVIGCYYLTLMINKNNTRIEKWFSSEEEVLKAFYNKKLTLHTPVLVRYNIDSFKITVENNTFKFFDKVTRVDFNNKEIKVHKIFQVEKSMNKFYLITTIGILIADGVSENNYQITKLFIETTAGRLIFSNNFKNVLN